VDVKLAIDGPGKIPAFLWRLWLGFRSLSYSDPGKRDMRLDFLRGLAISAMVVDHIGGDTFLTTISGGNRWIVSAAEFFVFLSGLVLGIVYGSRMKRAGFGAATTGLLRRALTLYQSSVGMALGFVALFMLTELRLWVDRPSGLGLSNPLDAVVGIITLHHSYHGSDVLVMYTIMLVFSPVVFLLLHQGRIWYVLGGSFALWSLYQGFPQQSYLPWTVTNSFFPVASWQLLLILGIVVGYYRGVVTGWLCGGGASCRLTVLTAAFALYLLVRTYQLFGDAQLPQALFGDATYSSLFAKEGLGPGRVLAFLCVGLLAYTVVNLLWVPLYRSLGWLMLPLGQSSLYVYVAHLYVLVVLYNMVPHLSWIPADAINISAQTVGLGVCWLQVRYQFASFVVPRHGPHHTVG